jgi:thioredoxin 1
MGPLEKVTAETFEEQVLNSDQPVLVEFSTSTCPACHAARPILERLADDFAGRARVVELNVEEEGELANFFQIRSVPTLAFFKNGRFVDGVMGAPPAAILRRKLDQLTGSCAPRG